MSFSSGGLADSCLQEDFSEAGSISPSSSDLIPDRSHGADALQVWGFFGRYLGLQGQLVVVTCNCAC